MRDDLVQKLYADYPSIFRAVDRDAELESWCSVDVGDGWYGIINLICSIIVNNEEANRKWVDYRTKNGETVPESEKLIDVKAIQVKEKFGGLRFYVYGGNEFARGVIRMAEAMSYQICEECGEKGSPTQEGWIRTLCEKHKDERRWRQNESKAILSDS